MSDCAPGPRILDAPECLLPTLDAFGSMSGKNETWRIRDAGHAQGDNRIAITGCLQDPRRPLPHTGLQNDETFSENAQAEQTAREQRSAHPRSEPRRSLRTEPTLGAQAPQQPHGENGPADDADQTRVKPGSSLAAGLRTSKPAAQRSGQSPAQLAARPGLCSPGETSMSRLSA